MKYIFTESQLDILKNKILINEDFTAKNFPIRPNELKKLVNSQYEDCINEQYKYGCVGKIQTKKCTTEKGVLGGDYSEKKYGGDSNWSIVNKFDTNSKVHTEIIKIWKEETEGKEDLKTWVYSKVVDLFSNDGMYTERLVDVNITTIKRGLENESYAKKIVRDYFKLNPDEEGITYELYDHCSGDINDRKKGQDLVLNLNNETVYFQVKPFLHDENEIQLFDGGDRGYYFKVASWHNQTKYKVDNVDIILYVDTTKNLYIMFRNDHKKMITVSNPKKYPPLYIYYYENPLDSNFKLPMIKDTQIVPAKKTVERKKEKEIEYYKERIKYFQDKLKELGGGDETLTEMVNYYQSRLNKTII
jgi:hypothetical protein